MSVLPSDAVSRKQIPVDTGCIDYFPDALVAVAELSKIGNDQHNPGEPLHWAREKSTDEADALMRHFIQRGTRDSDGVRHTAKVAWRALAMLQKEIEDEREGGDQAAVTTAGPSATDGPGCSPRQVASVSCVCGGAGQCAGPCRGERT